MKHDVVRFDSPESTGLPVGTMRDALAEPPLSGEAVVLDREGMTLAMAIESGRREDNKPLFAWAATGLGCQRIHDEAHGLRGAA